MLTRHAEQTRGRLGLSCGTRRDKQDGPTYRPGQRPADHRVQDAGQAEQDQETDVVVVGAHGGAGTSTLVELLRPAWDMGAITAVHDGYPPVRSHGRPLVVVCHGTVPGARRATTAVTALHSAGEQITALVVVSDGAPEPADATARLNLLRDRVGGIVRMPYIAGLRFVDEPACIALPAKAHRALARIRDLADAQLAAPLGGEARPSGLIGHL